MTHFVGNLEKGDSCAVSCNGSTFLCRVVSTFPFDENLNSMYECVTPHGSVIVAGAVWVRRLTDEETDTLKSLEEKATSEGITPYLGRL